MNAQLLEQAFGGLGLDFQKLFPAPWQYEAHEWLVKEVPRYGTVINAVPSGAGLHTLPWEEWYRLEGRLYHHVLYLKKPPEYNEIFQAPAHDDIHPPRTLGRSWYVIEDPDMSPVLLRSR